MITCEKKNLVYFKEIKKKKKELRCKFPKLEWKSEESLGINDWNSSKAPAKIESDNQNLIQSS